MTVTLEPGLTAEATCDPPVIGAAHCAGALLSLAHIPDYRAYLRDPENVDLIENAFESLKALLVILHRTDA